MTPQRRKKDSELMGYSEKIFNLASETLEKRKIKAESDAKIRHDRLIFELPEIYELEDKMRKSAYGLAGVIGMGAKTAEYIEKLKKDNLEAQREIRNILISNGYAENYFEPEYTCFECSDTGIKNGKLCKCHLKLLRQLSYEQLCKSSPLKISSFDDFDLDFYKTSDEAYDQMSRIFRYCVHYSENFDMKSDSLFLMGGTGLGKTHLSLAIAGKVLDKGYGVVYGSAQNLFSDIEREHFGRSDNPDGTTEKMLLECDLLILDDLGAEFITNFSVATFANIINTRLLTCKPTIISTNYDFESFNKRYSGRTASRILGEYKILVFEGEDIRQQKLGH